MGDFVREGAADGPVRFEDSDGVAWEVREIQQPELHATTSGVGLAFGEFGHGWLLFTADDAKRRLPAPFPPDWRTLSASELERWCRRARPATPISAAARREAML